MRAVNLDKPDSWELQGNERMCVHDDCPNVDDKPNMLYVEPGAYYCRAHTGEHAHDLPKGSPNDPDN